MRTPELRTQKKRSMMVAMFLFVIIAIFLSPISSRAVDFAGGTGEPNDPYRIATAEQLIGLGEDPNLYDKHFVLIADIDLDPNLPGRRVFDRAVIAPDIDDADCVFQGQAFSGTLNGMGHVIGGLVIEAMGKYVGFFGRIDTYALIQDIQLIGASVYTEIAVSCRSGSAVGILVGENGGAIVACHSSGFLHGPSAVGGLAGINLGSVVNSSSDVSVWGEGVVGGLVGSNCGIIRRCYSDGSINTPNNGAGGLVGSNDNEIAFSYSHARVSGRMGLGGLVSHNRGNIAYSYAAGKIHPAADASGSSIGGLVGSSEAGTIYSCYWDVQTTEIHTSDGGTGKTTEEMQSAATYPGWGNGNTWVLREGHGYPRLVWENTDGNLIVDITHGYAGGNGDVNEPYRIESREHLLNLAHHAQDWDKHFILCRTIRFEQDGQALPCPIGNTWKPFSGVFDGDAYEVVGFSYGRIDLHVREGQSRGPDYVGLFGIIAKESRDPNRESGVVRNLVLSNVSIKANQHAGALAGQNRGTIENCMAIEVSIEAGSYAGGLVGDNLGEIENCRVQGKIKGLGNYIGGLAGIHSRQWQHGFYRHVFIDSCSSFCQVSGRQGVGGLIGSSSATIQHSFSDSSVEGSMAIGGLLGYHYGDAHECFSLGSVRGEAQIGGLVGYNGEGGRDVSSGKVFFCYSHSQVAGTLPVGGLVGENGGSISSSYCTGLVNGQGNVGGFVGVSSGTDAAYGGINFWNRETSAQSVGIALSDLENVLGITTAEMQTAQTFIVAGWDFNEVWMLCEGDYPHLRWEGVQCGSETVEQ